jgi:hypothetical protein
LSACYLTAPPTAEVALVKHQSGIRRGRKGLSIVYCGHSRRADQTLVTKAALDHEDRNLDIVHEYAGASEGRSYEFRAEGEKAAPGLVQEHGSHADDAHGVILPRRHRSFSSTWVQ